MYIFIESDNLDKKARAQAKISGGAGADGSRSHEAALRRPHRGIQIKNDTYAALSIWSGGQIEQVLKSESAIGEGKVGLVSQYFDFILQSVEDSRQEKVQVMETFGDPYVYFYGERPRFVTFRGVLINTEDFNWRSQFWYNYDNYLRGTRLVERGARAYLAYDSIVVEGYPITAQATDTIDAPYSIPFSITMLVTNYFDFSNVGTVAFPGDKKANADAVNKELRFLKANREGYVSTGLMTRLQNLNNAPASGIASEIRKGIRSVNKLVGAAGALADTLQNVVGGRTVRLPIGIAGFLANTGAAVVAGGSLGSFSQTAFDKLTGQYRDIMGSVKLRMPGTAWFTQINAEATPRGRKSDNIDEYPMRSDDPSILKDLLSSKQYLDMKERQAVRQQAAVEHDVTLNAWNLVAEAGSLVSDLADGVNMLKTGFGMALSAVGFMKDPKGVLRASLGLGLGYFDMDLAGRAERLFNTNDKDQLKKLFPDSVATHYPAWTRSPTMIKQKMEELGLENLSPEAKEQLEKQLGSDAFSTNSAQYIRRVLEQEGITALAEAAGATTKSDTSFSERQSFIGAKAKEQNQKFSQVLQDEKLKLDLFGDPDVELDLGVVYQSSQYLTQSFGVTYPVESAVYEDVYGSNDYTTLEQRSTGSVEAIQTIKEAYDDIYINQPSEITEQAIQDVYGAGYQSNQVRTAAEIADILRRMFGGEDQETESQEGIRGIDDEDTAIEPVR